MLHYLSHIHDRLFNGSDRAATCWRISLIALVGVIAYANTFTMAFNFDDNSNLFGVNALRNVGPLRELFNLRPMRSVGDISFALTYRLFGTSVVAYHVGNLLIHICTAWLVAALVMVTGRTPFMTGTAAVPAEQSVRTARVAALLAGLLFVAHPIQTQAVTYIVQRYASLATLWYVATLVCFARARLALAGRCWLDVAGWAIFALLATFFAMKSKEIAFTLPVALLLYEACFFTGSLKWRLTIIGGFLAMLAVIPYSMYGSGFLQNAGAIWDSLRVQTSMSRSDYLLSQFPVIVKYLRLILYPVGQSIEHLAVSYHSFWVAPVWGSFAVLLGLFTVGVLLLWQGKRGRPEIRLIGFGMLFFFLGLSVESSIIPIVDLMFEHRVYLPFIGLSLAVGTGSALLAQHVNRAEMVTVVAILIGLLLAGITHARNEVWRTPVSLWRDAAVKAPASSRAWNNLAYAYLREKRPAEALPALIRAIELNPGPPDAWNNIGIALEQIGRYQGRFQRDFNMFRSAEDLKNQTTWFANAYNNLGLAHEFLGQPAAAIQSYQKAATYLPDLAVAYFNLGLSALMLNNQPLAEEQYQRLLRLDPQFAAELGRLLGH